MSFLLLAGGMFAEEVTKITFLARAAVGNRRLRAASLQCCTSRHPVRMSVILA